MKKYIVAGFRKGAKDNGAYNFNAYLYTEEELRRMFEWIDGPDGNNFRKGAQKLTLDGIMQEVKKNGHLWCENDNFFYVFKLV